jgi:cytochrome P450
MAEPDFFADPAVIANPKSFFELMRSQAPVKRETYRGTLMVTGYEEALEVLNNRAGAYSSACSVVGPIPGLPFEAQGPDIRDQLDAHRAEMPWADHLVCFDGQKHTDHRAVLGSLLTYKRLRQNEDYLHSLADRLIDGFIGNDRCNVVP